MSAFDMMAVYYTICETEYPETYRSIQSLTDTVYTQHELDRACAEVAYIKENGKLPEWATVIESFEVDDDGSYIFVYRDKTH